VTHHTPLPSLFKLRIYHLTPFFAFTSYELLTVDSFDILPPILTLMKNKCLHLGSLPGKEDPFSRLFLFGILHSLVPERVSPCSRYEPPSVVVFSTPACLAWTCAAFLPVSFMRSRPVRKVSPTHVSKILVPSDLYLNETEQVTLHLLTLYLRFD